MNKLEKRQSKNVTVINELGLHARPAAVIAKIATKAKDNIWMIKDGEKVDASSIIDILSLSCLKDSKIVLQTDDPADNDILDEIVAFFNKGFKG
jgi:phosphocarrier protein HPr